jgi:hydrogenase-4 membrane subunit HyfE
MAAINRIKRFILTLGHSLIPCDETTAAVAALAAAVVAVAGFVPKWTTRPGLHLMALAFALRVVLVGVVLLARVHLSIVHAIIHVQNHPHPHLLLEWNSKMNLN